MRESLFDLRDVRMLQIATGMYFDDGPRYETVHRAVFYTNAAALRWDSIEVPFGRLLFASGITSVTALTIEAIDRLPENDPDGEPSFLKATGGTELLDDAASVFAFWGNVTCSRHLSLVERLIPKSPEPSPSRGASAVLRRTCDPQVILVPEVFDGFRQFCSSLLALRRDHFEAAMRAMHKVVDACTLVTEDPGLAYMLFVSAIESLALLVTSPADFLDWNRYDSAKRVVIDAALDGLDADAAARVREAVVRADQLSLSRRFKQFTSDHIEPSFFRGEASDAVRPIRSHDLPHALDVAYRLRSRNVHELRDLEPELWVIADRAETLRWEGRSVLGLEGLNRLCRHVIRTFIDRSPTDLDTTFDYRSQLPGIVRVQLAPQYWVGRAGDFRAQDAPSHLQGFIELLCPLLLEEQGSMPADLSAILERIEGLLPSERSPIARRPMIAIYILWHQVMKQDVHRPEPAKIIEGFASDLTDPSIEAFTVRLMLGNDIDWTTDQFDGLASDRLQELERGRGQPLPARFDTALVLAAARVLWDDGDHAGGCERVAQAVESLPGHEPLLTLERTVNEGSFPDFDLRRFALGADDWLADSSEETTNT